MPKVTLHDEEVKHVHRWAYQYGDLSCERCSCGAIRVSEAEHQRRLDEWNNYFELVKTTDSYRDYQEMKEAFKAKDIEKMREIRARISKRCKRLGDFEDWDQKWWYDEDHYLPKPKFPDPMRFNYEIA